MEPDWETLEARLGMAFGSTLRALVTAAYEVRPDAPSIALIDAGVRLRWIDPDFDGTVEDLRQPSTPVDVLPIIETGMDLQHFGFLMRRGQVPFLQTPIDKRSVVSVVKDDPPAEAFTKNLRGLLSIAATIGLQGVTRAELRRAATLRSPEDSGFRLASHALTTIPGVQVLEDATTVLDLRELTFVYPDAEKVPPFVPPSRASWEGKSAWSALSAAEQCVAHGFPAEALEFSALALECTERLAFDSSDFPTSTALAATLRADYVRRVHLVRLDAAAVIKDPKRSRELLVEAHDAFASLPFLHAAYWRELEERMPSLGVVDPDLGRRIEARAVAAESDSL